MIEFALNDYLGSQAAITADVATNIYPIRIPRGVTGKKLTYRRKSGPRGSQLSGGIGVAKGEFEVASLSKVYDEAKLLSRKVRQALHGLTNTTWGTTPNDVNVRYVEHLDEEDDFFDPEDGSDDGHFMVINTFRITYEEAATEF